MHKDIEQVLLIGGPADGKRVFIPAGLNQIIFPVPNEKDYDEIIYKRISIKSSNKEFCVYTHDMDYNEVFETLIKNYRDEQELNV